MNFSGHAINKLQGYGIPPTAAIDTIKNGSVMSQAGTDVYYGAINNLSVVVNSVTGRVVTVSYGYLKPR